MSSVPHGGHTRPGTATPGPMEPWRQEIQVDDDMGAVRAGYDMAAAEYARRFRDELDHKPLDRELLHRFARQVANRGEVCDLGCGPGHIARFLRDAGVSVFGLDLSPAMLRQARRLNPDIAYREGNMMALNLPDASLAGIAAFYSIVNFAGETMPAVFREMARVLRSGGLLLLAFHTGEGRLYLDEFLGQPVSMDFFFFPPATIRRQLEAEGFTVEEIMERAAYAPEVEYPSRRAYIFARRVMTEVGT